MIRQRPVFSAVLVPLAIAAATCGRAGAEGQAGQSSVPLARPEALELRRVYAGAFPNFYPSNPSPDGRLISEIDWSTGDLAVVDLASGQMRRVTNKGPWSDSPDYAEFSVFSPDGQRMAYSWFSGDVRGYQVRTIKLDGTDMRIVFPRRPDVSYVAVEDWSRDGSSLLVTVFRTDRTTQLGVVSVADGTYRSLKTNDWRPPSVLTFSPDGRFVAYDLARSTERRERDIFVMAADGSRETMVVGGQDDNRLLGWLPDGSGILYQRRSANAAAVLAHAIKDGRASGRPQLVRPDLAHLEPFGFSSDAYFYGVAVEQPHVQTAGVDLKAGRMVTEPRGFADAVEGQSHDSAWSPDGQTIAYLVNAPVGASMVLRGISGEFRRQIFVPLSQARKTHWAPDASAILMYGVDPEGRAGIHRVDLRNGALTTVIAGGPSAETEGLAFWDLSPDGRTIYYRRPREANQLHLMAGQVIVAHDIRTGTRRELTGVPSGRVMSVSPDGKWLAFHAANAQLKETQLLVIPTAGGQARVISHWSGGTSLGNRGGIEWSPDGTSVLFFYAPADKPGGIWQIPVNGGEPRLLLDRRVLDPQSRGEQSEFRNFRLSPDGRQIVFEAGRFRGEFWMMSGFAAAQK